MNKNRFSYVVSFLVVLFSNTQGVAFAEQSRTIFDPASLITLSDRYYQQQASQIKASGHTAQSPSQLKHAYLSLINQKKYHDANTLIIANFATVKKHLISNDTLMYLQHLLRYSTSSYADLLMKNILDSKSSVLTPVANYIYADHHYINGDYDKAFEYLQNIGNDAWLTKDQSDHATLMFGSILQNRKMHRQALEVFDRIEETSTYYQYAQLNSAVSSIRQGWWTDAQLEINRALSITTDGGLDLRNRLLLMLGYSQFQHEFYRNARETFRSVSLDNQYTNQALLGIGLCAIAQKDYTGAINAFSRLKTAPEHDIYSAEAHLMVPFTYDKAGDNARAEEGYLYALSYFEKERTRHTLAITELKHTHSLSNSSTIRQRLDSRTNIQLSEIEAMRRNSSDTDLLKALNNIERQLTTFAILDLINDENTLIEQLDSYASQAQYGLAKIYDTE